MDNINIKVCIDVNGNTWRRKYIQENNEILILSLPQLVLYNIIAINRQWLTYKFWCFSFLYVPVWLHKLVCIVPSSVTWTALSVWNSREVSKLCNIIYTKNNLFCYLKNNNKIAEASPYIYTCHLYIFISVWQI